MRGEEDSDDKNSTWCGIAGLRGRMDCTGRHVDLHLVWVVDVVMMRNTINDMIFGAVCCAVVLLTLWSFIGC
mgnify:CR=1 FL=1